MTTLLFWREMGDDVSRNFNNSMDKGLRLLEYFTADKPAYTLTELAQAAGIPKATAFRLATSMERHGLLRRNGQGQLCLGLRFLLLASLVARQIELREVALPHLMALRDRIGQAVELLIRADDEAVVVASLEPGRPGTGIIGQREPLHWGIGPRVLLAHQPMEYREYYLRNLLSRRNGSAGVDATSLRQMLSEIRENGFATDGDEEGWSRLAVPIGDPNGEVRAAIALNVGDQTAPGGGRAECLALLKATAAAIAAEAAQDSAP
ncbi:MAG: IclR family transcriptional regulator [Bacillota bacterium]